MDKINKTDSYAYVLSPKDKKFKFKEVSPYDIHVTSSSKSNK